MTQWLPLFRESALSNTVILQVADLPFATAVITAVPTPFALTVPFSFTAAIVKKNETVAWSSSDDTVAAVDKNGLVRAKKAEVSELFQITFLFSPTISGTSLMELPVPLVLSRIASIFRESALSHSECWG